METANGTVEGAKRRMAFPDYRRSVALTYVKRGYHVLFRHVPTFILVPLGAMLLLELLNLYQAGELQRLWNVARQTHLTLNLVAVVLCCTLLAVVVLSYLLLQTRPVYLVDFAVCRPPESWKVTTELFMERSRICKAFTDQSLEFQEKILTRSGLGQETYFPPGVFKVPQDTSMQAARKEFEEVIFTAVADALEKAGLRPRDIGIIIVNCSLFNPTPSLSAMIINHFRMPSNIVSYNLSGMGCSAGIIAVDLARQMLQLHPNSYALVVSTENITQNWYRGNQRSMLIPNCIFRVGGAAIVLSNKRKDAWRSKYELSHLVRTHLGSNDAAYSCIFQSEDDQGVVGVKLSKTLMSVAGEALKANITTLGPLVLPASEQLLFLLNLIGRKFNQLVGGKKIKPYIPDFNLAFEHICIHTGGRAVVDEIEKQLHLSPKTVEPSRATLYRYGNVSSSSIWYVLAYLESQGSGVRKGDRVWQLGFGSGFKCNSAVWRALRRNTEKHRAWEGFDVDGMRKFLEELCH